MANVRAQWQGHAEKPRGPDPCPGELELGVVQPQGWGQPAGKAECRGREVAGPAHHSVHLSLHPERVGTPSRHQREKQGPRNLPLRLHTHPSSQNPTVHGAVALAKWAKGLEPPTPCPMNTQLASCLGTPQHPAVSPGTTSLYQRPLTQPLLLLRCQKTTGPGAERPQKHGENPDVLKQRPQTPEATSFVRLTPRSRPCSEPTGPTRRAGLTHHSGGGGKASRE